MTLQRLNASQPDFTRLNEMLTAMKGLLGNNRNTVLRFEELLSFQDSDGSFNLLDSFQVPGDARVDFCYIPTYLGAAILMREYLKGRQGLKPALEMALNASLHRGFQGHGYEADKGCIDTLNIFIQGGLRDFLETQCEFCPEFHQLIHNILHRYNSCLLQKLTRGAWGEDYGSDWQSIVDRLRMRKRLYAAYGSNMDKSQMSLRCPDALAVGKTYLEDWELTIPFYADIEPAKGKRTPALIWEISADDEKSLDRYEGYPNFYVKTEIIVNLFGERVSAMAYIMTDKYKKTGKSPRNGYVEQILQGYRDAGFSVGEFDPRRQIQ